MQERMHRLLLEFMFQFWGDAFDGGDIADAGRDGIGVSRELWVRNGFAYCASARSWTRAIYR